MSMVFCRGCGKEIHETAVTCPHCGAPQRGTSVGAPVAAGFFEMALNPLKNYAGFSGRARRKEYWFFALFLFIVQFLVGLMLGIAGAKEPTVSTFTGLISLATIIPTIAVGVRRMHDTDRSGWWLLLPIVNLVFLCLDSHPGTNRFGVSPKYN